MRPDELIERLRQRPFEPFTIHLSDGTTYEVRHPEFLMVGRSLALHFTPSPEVDGAFERYRTNAVFHAADGEKQYDEVEQKLQSAPAVTVPTITIGSDFDGATIDGAAYRAKFTSRYEHRIFKGVGHNVPQEAPKDFAKAVLDADKL